MAEDRLKDVWTIPDRPVLLEVGALLLGQLGRRPGRLGGAADPLQHGGRVEQ